VTWGKINLDVLDVSNNWIELASFNASNRFYHSQRIWGCFFFWYYWL